MNNRRRIYNEEEEDDMRRYRILEYSISSYPYSGYAIFDTENKRSVLTYSSSIGPNINIIGSKFYLFGNTDDDTSGSSVVCLDSDGNIETLGTITNYSISGYPFSINGEFYGLISTFLDSNYSTKGYFQLRLITSDKKVTLDPTNYIKIIKNGELYRPEEFYAIRLLWQDPKTENFILFDDSNYSVNTAVLDIDSLEMTIMNEESYFYGDGNLMINLGSSKTI